MAHIASSGTAAGAGTGHLAMAAPDTNFAAGGYRSLRPAGRGTTTPLCGRNGFRRRQAGRAGATTPATERHRPDPAANAGARSPGCDRAATAHRPSTATGARSGSRPASGAGACSGARPAGGAGTCTDTRATSIDPTRGDCRDPGPASSAAADTASRHGGTAADATGTASGTAAVSRAIAIATAGFPDAYELFIRPADTAGAFDHADDFASGTDHAGLLARAASGRHRHLAVLESGRGARRSGLAQ